MFFSGGESGSWVMLSPPADRQQGDQKGNNFPLAQAFPPQ
jgi:hypothetical protein